MDIPDGQKGHIAEGEREEGKENGGKIISDTGKWARQKGDYNRKT